MAPHEHTLSRLLRERGHHLSDPLLFALARAEAHASEAAMTMSVHDACEAWAEGRLPIERALELTGAADVPELLVLCDCCDVSRLLIEGPDAWHARQAALQARDAETHMPDEEHRTGSYDSSGEELVWWWIERSDRLEIARVRFEGASWRADVVGSDRPIGPEDARLVLAVVPIVARRRHEEVVDFVRSAPDVPPEPGDELPEGWESDPKAPLLPVTSPRIEAALVKIMRDTGFSAAQISGRFPDRIEPGGRVAIRTDDLSDEELAMILATDLSHLGDEDDGP